MSALPPKKRTMTNGMTQVEAEVAGVFLQCGVADVEMGQSAT